MRFKSPRHKKLVLVSIICSILGVIGILSILFILGIESEVSDLFLTKLEVLALVPLWVLLPLILKQYIHDKYWGMSKLEVIEDTLVYTRVYFKLFGLEKVTKYTILDAVNITRTRHCTQIYGEIVVEPSKTKVYHTKLVGWVKIHRAFMLENILLAEAGYSDIVKDLCIINGEPFNLVAHHLDTTLL